MKLAEALMLRSDYLERINKLKDRIINNLTVQEGDKVSEDPNPLIAELNDVADKLNEIIIKINNTNNNTAFNDKLNLSSALTYRDTLKKKRNNLEQIVLNASGSHMRLSRSEIKLVKTVDISALQKDIDKLSKEFREIDTKIQEKNWLTDIL